MLGVVFLKIYQHNVYIKTVYDYQRLEQEYGALEKQRNELLVGLYNQKQPINIMHESEAQGMSWITLDTLITATHIVSIDFVNSSSCDPLVKEAFGLVMASAKGRS